MPLAVIIASFVVVGVDGIAAVVVVVPTRPWGHWRDNVNGVVQWRWPLIAFSTSSECIRFGRIGYWWWVKWWYNMLCFALKGSIVLVEISPMLPDLRMPLFVPTYEARHDLGLKWNNLITLFLISASRRPTHPTDIGLDIASANWFLLLCYQFSSVFAQDKPWLDQLTLAEGRANQLWDVRKCASAILCHFAMQEVPQTLVT